MAKKVFGATILRDVLGASYGTDDWLVEGLIPTQTLTVISGMPASYKTWACLRLALCVSERKPFLGKFNVPFRRNVLILDKENVAKHVKERLEALCAPIDAFVWFNFDGDFYLDNEDHVVALLKYIEQENIGLVVLDSLIRFHRGDENDSKQIALVLGNLKKVTSAGASVIFTHHHRKELFQGATSPNSLRGSSDIFAAVDSHIALSYQKKDNVVIFSQHKLRQAQAQDEFAAKVIIDTEHKTLDLEFVGEYDKQKEKRDEAKKAVISVFAKSDESELSLVEVDEMVEKAFSRSVLNAALTQLVDEGRLTKTVGKSNKAFYSLTVGTSESQSDSSVDN